MAAEVIDICWVYQTRFSKVGCHQKWVRFHSRYMAKKWMKEHESKSKHMFFRYILVNNVEVESL